MSDIIELQAVPADTEQNLTKGQRVEKWLLDRWDFRYNDVKNVSEYRKKDTKEWLALDDDWDRSDEGFEAQIRNIEEFADKHGIELTSNN